ncbi:MAG: Crp/Fnr family transcriptional regulator [bacterium]
MIHPEVVSKGIVSRTAPPLERAGLTEQLSVVQLHQNSTVYPCQNPVQHFYWLKEGVLGLYRYVSEDKKVLLNKIFPGETVGITQLLRKEVFPARLRPITQCTALQGKKTHLDQLERYSKQALQEVLVQDNSYHAQVIDRLDSILGGNVRERLAGQLLELIEELGRPTSGGILLDIELSRADFRNMVNSTRESTSRVMSEFEENGIIRTTDKVVTVLQPEALRNIASNQAK